MYILGINESHTATAALLKDGEIIANWSVSVRCKGEKDAFSLSVTPLGPCPKNLYAQIAEMVPKTPEAVYAPHPVISEEID